MFPSIMSSFVPTFAVLLLAGLALGCGARSTLEDAVVADAARVTDCVRRTPDAVPLARIAALPEGGGADPNRLGADEDFLYFISEGRVFRLGKATGAPQPLTPPGSAGRALVVRGDSVFWSTGTDVFRVPVGGADPEFVGVAPGPWIVSGQDLITSGPYNQSAPVIRTPFGGGPSEEILPIDPSQFVVQLAPVPEGILVQRSQEIVLIPETGAPVQLGDSMTRTAAPPVEDGGFVYFGAANDHWDATLQRVAVGGGAASDVLLDGFAVALVIVGDTLYAHVVLRRPGDVVLGAIVHLPTSGGEVTAMATTDSTGEISTLGGSVTIYSYPTSGFAADADHVYFVERCTDLPEYRLVSLPADHVISL